MLRQAVRRGHNGRPGWKLYFDYDPDEVEALKRAIPHIDRAWDEEHKYWWVAIEYQDTVLKLFPEFEGYLHQLEMPL